VLSLSVPRAPQPDPRLDAALLQHCRRPPVEVEVIIPAFNEERRLPGTVAGTLAYLAGRSWSSAVVVVDNASVDRTAEITRRFPRPAVPVHVIGCSERGKGSAVRRGILTSSARFIGFIDADNATPIASLDEAMILLHRGYDAVIGSRRVAGARYEVEQSLTRRGGGWAFRRLTRLVLPDIADTQCGFKFFRGAPAREIAEHCHINGFAFDVELLSRLLRTGHAVAERPVAWSDRPGSTFSARRDGLRTMADLCWIALARESGGPG
jgi:dolichyl-phosphate beta-glucosyltransferase